MKIIVVLFVLLLATLLIYSALYFTESNNGIKEVQISNISSNSATISWVTDTESKSSVQYSKTNDWTIMLDKVMAKDTAYDDRNVEQKDGNYTYSDSKGNATKFHHVTLRNLEPETTYYFRINGMFRTFEVEDNNLKTNVLDEKSVSLTPDPIYGKVDNYSGDEDPKDGIVYFSIKSRENGTLKSALYSSVINETSSWAQDLSLVKDSEGKVFEWNEINFDLEIEAKTNVGYGWQETDLENYKPLDDIIVNIRYVAPI